MLSYKPSKNTKIVATIGPASDTEELIERLIFAGVNIFRFNFKHGEVSWYEERVQRVRKVSDKIGTIVGTMMDLQGPSFRIILDEAQKEIKSGQKFDLGSTEFTLTHPHIIKSLVKGQKLLIDDGTITFEVSEDPKSDGSTVEIVSHSDAVLKTRKSLNIPGADFPIDLFTDRDMVGLDIAVSQGMEIVAFSFARSADDIVAIRKVMDSKNCRAQICAKLETVQSLDNLESIVKETDMVMVARGDLGVEAPIEGLAIYQKRIIETSLKYGKPVITATQMLASMEANKLPTRAEVSDVANAVFDNTDATMLSGESAVGKYPVEAVAMMATIASKTESEGSKYRRRLERLVIDSKSAVLAHTAFKLYDDCQNSGQKVSAFLVFTESGRSARLLAHFRPDLPIHAFTVDKMIAGAMCAYFGVIPHIVPNPETKDVQHTQVVDAVQRLKEKGFVSVDDNVIVLHGDLWGDTGGTSTVRLVKVA
jgi:pyruvate kinase